MSKDNSSFFEEKKEWSKTKDELLGSYLLPYFTKLLRTDSNICYVDCFAGAGLFDDGSKGSPLIAIDCREKAVGVSKVQGARSRIHCVFVEKKHAEKLKVNVETATKLSCCNKPVIYAGEHETEVENILFSKLGYNVFLYIDPFGVRPLPFSLFERLCSMRFASLEILLNFNSFGFFRWACSAMKIPLSCSDMRKNTYDGMDDFYFNKENATVTRVNEVAGGQYWKRIVLKYKKGVLNAHQAESQLALLYKRKLMRLFNYALDIPLRDKENHMPKYRMIHACNHYEGCKLMADQMINRAKKLYLKIQKEETPSLFDEFSDFSSNLHDGDFVEKTEVRKGVVEVLRKVKKRLRLKEFLAHYIVEKGLINNFKVIIDHLKELECEIPGFVERETKEGHMKVSRSWTDDSRSRVFLNAHLV